MDHSEWLAQRSDAELALLAEHNAIREGRQPLPKIDYKAFRATLQRKRIAPRRSTAHRLDAMADQIVAACANYVARNVGPLVDRVKTLEARIAQLERT